MQYSEHYSVLKRECIDFLTENSVENSLFVDLTFGGGGHSFAILEKNPTFRVIATDQDPEALQNGREQVKKHSFEDRIELIPTNFVNFPKLWEERKDNSDRPMGILIDLGVSSHHFDSGERGFSFRSEAQLDMRMNNSDDQLATAADIVNSYSVDELEEIFSEYGEERFSRRIAEKVVEERSKSPIETTKQLENIIFHCYPKKSRFGKLNPSTRCFQALRIAVNRELEVLSSVLPKLLPILNYGGRLAVISFHSLEDRIVKRAFKSVCKEDKRYSLLFKRPLIPEQQELDENPRSRSAKLRVIERVKED